MIGKLKGFVDSIEKDYLILDVNGVGYKVQCSSKVLDSLTRESNPKVELYIETIVREDQISLLGFLSKSEQDCFTKLTTVQGVGAKLALVILGALTPDKIALALASQDAKAFSAISGVGPKLTNRIITELKDKHMDFTADFMPTMQTEITDNKTMSNLQQDAISALVNLGISKSDAFVAVNKILADNPNTTISELIRTALKARS